MLPVLFSLLIALSMNSGTFASNEVFGNPGDSASAPYLPEILMAIENLPGIPSVATIKANGVFVPAVKGASEGFDESAPYLPEIQRAIEEAANDVWEIPSIETIKANGVFVPATDGDLLRAPSYCPSCGYAPIVYIGAYFYTEKYLIAPPGCMNDKPGCRDWYVEQHRVNDYECSRCHRIVSEHMGVVYSGKVCPAVGWK